MAPSRRGMPRRPPPLRAAVLAVACLLPFCSALDCASQGERLHHRLCARRPRAPATIAQLCGDEPQGCARRCIPQRHTMHNKPFMPRSVTTYRQLRGAGVFPVRDAMPRADCAPCWLAPANVAEDFYLASSRGYVTNKLKIEGTGDNVPQLFTRCKDSETSAFGVKGGQQCVIADGQLSCSSSDGASVRFSPAGSSAVFDLPDLYIDSSTLAFGELPALSGTPTIPLYAVPVKTTFGECVCH